MNLSIFKKIFKGFKKKVSLLVEHTLSKNNEDEFSSKPLSNKSKKTSIPLLFFFGIFFFYILFYSRGSLIIQYQSELDDVSEVFVEDSPPLNSELKRLSNLFDLRITEDNVSSDLAKDSLLFDRKEAIAGKAISNNNRKNRNNKSKSNEKFNRWIKQRISFTTKIPLKFLFIIFFVIHFISNNKAEYTLKLF